MENTNLEFTSVNSKNLFFNRLTTDLPGMNSPTHGAIDLVGSVNPQDPQSALYLPLRKLIDPVIAFDSELAEKPQALTPLPGETESKPPVYLHPFFFTARRKGSGTTGTGSFQIVSMALGYDLSALIKHELPDMKETLDGEKTVFLAALFGKPRDSYHMLRYVEEKAMGSGLYKAILTRVPTEHATGKLFFESNGFAEYCENKGFTFLIK